MPRKPLRPKQPKASTSKAPVSQESEDDSSSSDDSESEQQTSRIIANPPPNIQLLITNLVKYVLNHTCNKIAMKRAGLFN